MTTPGWPTSRLTTTRPRRLRPRCCATQSPGSPTVAWPSSGVSPTTAAATSPACGATPGCNWASPRRRPASTGGRPTARSSGSIEPSPRAGPSRSSTTPNPPGSPLCQHGSTSTTTTGPTPPSASAHPSPGWTTWLDITPSGPRRGRLADAAAAAVAAPGHLVTVVNRYAGNSLRGRVAIYVVGSTSLVLFVAAQSVLDAERGAKGGNISNFGEALWWAMTAVSTVGYGDRFPVTEAGRFIAGGLMLAGIALLGVVTASLESWLIERVIEVEEDAQAAVRRAVLDLTREVAALRDELRQGREQSRGRGID